MFISQKFLFSIFLIRIFLPMVLVISSPIIVDPETNEPIRWRELPEYKEYLKQLGKTLGSSTVIPSSTIENVGAKFGQLQDSPLGPLSQLPAIHLCKESPKDNDIYGHAYCLAMFIMYILLILCLIIYVVRSLIRLTKQNRGNGAGNSFELMELAANKESKGVDQLDHIKGPQILEAHSKGLRGKEIAEYIGIVDEQKKPIWKAT
jgi:hypothetical protein